MAGFRLRGTTRLPSCGDSATVLAIAVEADAKCCCRRHRRIMAAGQRGSVVVAPTCILPSNPKSIAAAIGRRHQRPRRQRSVLLAAVIPR